MKPGAPPVRKEGNVSQPNRRQQGDVEAALREAKAVSEGTYSVAVRTHCSLEPHGVTCRWDDDQHLTCWASTQGVTSVHDDLVQRFQLPPENVQVITEVMGGGFGSKFGAGYEGIICAQLAKKAKAPVKMMLDRKEEQLAVGNAPSATAQVRIGADAEGKIVGIDAKLHGTGGINGAGVPFPYIYNVGAFRIEQSSVFINAGAQRAWRAPGHPQASFLMEAAVEDLAVKLGIDPLEMRLKNDISDGEPFCTGEIMHDTHFHDILRSAAEQIGYGTPKPAPVWVRSPAPAGSSGASAAARPSGEAAAAAPSRAVSSSAATATSRLRPGSRTSVRAPAPMSR